MRAILLVTVLLVARTSSAQVDTSGSGTVTISASDLPPQVSQYIGIASSGGTSLSCPSGKMVVGIAGTRLKFIQKLTPICGSFNKDGSIASSSPVDASAIGIGAAGFKLECGNARVVSKARVAYQENTQLYPYLGGVEISCSPWSLGYWSNPPIVKATVNFDGWQKKDVVTCNNYSQPVRAIRIRNTTSLKALSIVCDEP